MKLPGFGKARQPLAPVPRYDDPNEREADALRARLVEINIAFRDTIAESGEPVARKMLAAELAERDEISSKLAALSEQREAGNNVYIRAAVETDAAAYGALLREIALATAHLRRLNAERDAYAASIAGFASLLPCRRVSTPQLLGSPAHPSNAAVAFIEDVMRAGFVTREEIDNA